MDFTNRGADAHQTNPNQTSPANSSAPARPTGRPEKSRGRLATRYDRGSDEKLLRVVTVILLLSIAIILIFLAVLFYISPGDQGHYVKKNGYQAVDLSIGGANSGDQIYFAKITSINSRYFVLQNVFYIPSTQKNTNVTLSPLVCQIDAPYDQMIVNHSSINWWENLQPSSKVVTSITKYQKSNNGKPTCPSSASAKSSNQTGSGSSTNQQSSNSTTGSNSSSSTTGTNTSSTGTSKNSTSTPPPSANSTVKP